MTDYEAGTFKVMIYQFSCAWSGNCPAGHSHHIFYSK